MWWKKITFHNFFLAGGIINILTFAEIFITKSLLPPIIPLYYGKPVGIEQLSNVNLFFIVPGLAILILISNLFLNYSAKDEFIKKTFAITAFVVSLMSAITVTKIIFLVAFL